MTNVNVCTIAGEVTVSTQLLGTPYQGIEALISMYLVIGLYSTDDHAFKRPYKRHGRYWSKCVCGHRTAPYEKSWDTLVEQKHHLIDNHKEWDQ